MKSTKRSLAVLTVCAMILSLAGCGESTPAATQAATQATQAATQAAETEAAQTEAAQTEAAETEAATEATEAAAPVDRAYTRFRASSP